MMYNILNRSGVLFLLISFSFLFLFPLHGEELTARQKEKLLIEDLVSLDRLRVNSALAYIGQHRTPTMLHLLKEALLKDYKDLQIEMLVIALKLYNKEEILSHWLRILDETKSLKLKVEIIDYIYDIEDSRIVTAFSKQLRSPFHEVRKKTALALKKVGDDRMYPAIMNLAESTNPIYRIYAAEAMSYLYDKRFNSKLVGMLKDDNKSVRIYVLKYLLRNRQKDSLSRIRKLIEQDPDNEVRISAIEVVSQMEDKKALSALVKALKNKDKDIRMAAVKAIRHINLKNAVKNLSSLLRREKDDTLKDEIIKTFIAFKKGGNLNGIRRVLLNDDDLRLRIKSAYTLGIIKDRDAISVLNEGYRDRDYRVRAEVCNSFGYYRDKSVLRSLIKIIKNEKTRYVRSAALYSVKRLRYKQSVVQLFDIYAVEKDTVFREQLRTVIRHFINEFID